MRAVLDPNVIIAALLAPEGSPAKVFRAWVDGAYEVVVSALLLAELNRVLACPKIAKRITPSDGEDRLDLLRRRGTVAEDPDDIPQVRSPNPGGDYLITLAATTTAVIVSGDDHLLGLAERIPVYSSSAFLQLIEAGS